MTEIRHGTVKICGLTEVAHASYAVEANADVIGLIFVPGRRRTVNTARAREIVASLRHQSPTSPLAVGVFRNAPASEINAIAREVGLDLIQLHGDEAPEFIDLLDLPALKVIGLTAGDTQPSASSRISAFARSSAPPVAYLLDDHRGGSGETVDWDLAAELAADWPVMLAGGLTPENVPEAIARVRPIGVDVSSGVESGERKDPAKIVRFVERARGAFSDLGPIQAPS